MYEKCEQSSDRTGQAEGVPGTDQKQQVATLPKVCPCCKAVLTIDDFVENAEVEPLGMTVDVTDPSFNYYYFNHECQSCGTTFAVNVLTFEPFIPEPIPPFVLAGTVECELHCTRIDDLAVCTRECRYAPYRRYLLQLRKKLSAD